jgi:hypothetical protein
MTPARAHSAISTATPASRMTMTSEFFAPHRWAQGTPYFPQIRSLARGYLIGGLRPVIVRQESSPACAAAPGAFVRQGWIYRRAMRSVVQAVGRGATGVKLQVRLAVRTLSVPVRGIRRLGGCTDGHTADETGYSFDL